MLHKNKPHSPMCPRCPSLFKMKLSLVSQTKSFCRASSAIAFQIGTFQGDEVMEGSSEIQKHTKTNGGLQALSVSQKKLSSGSRPEDCPDDQDHTQQPHSPPPKLCEARRTPVHQVWPLGWLPQQPQNHEGTPGHLTSTAAQHKNMCSTQEH